VPASHSEPGQVALPWLIVCSSIAALLLDGAAERGISLAVVPVRSGGRRNWRPRPCRATSPHKRWLGMDRR